VSTGCIWVGPRLAKHLLGVERQIVVWNVEEYGVKKFGFATLALLGSLFLASCGNQCPTGYNTTDPSCPGYTGYGYGYGQGYQQGYQQPVYGQPGYVAPVQPVQPGYVAPVQPGYQPYPGYQPTYGGVYGNPYNYPCAPGSMYCYPVR